MKSIIKVLLAGILTLGTAQAKTPIECGAAFTEVHNLLPQMVKGFRAKADDFDAAKASIEAECDRLRALSFIGTSACYFDDPAVIARYEKMMVRVKPTLTEMKVALAVCGAS